jgi:hypothetical protein
VQRAEYNICQMVDAGFHSALTYAKEFRSCLFFFLWRRSNASYSFARFTLDSDGLDGRRPTLS